MKKTKNMVRYCLLISLFLLTLLSSGYVLAQNDEELIIAQGNHGIDWCLTNDGVLYFGGGELKPPEMVRNIKTYPWSDHSSKIRQIIIEEEIVLPQDPHLFKGLINLIKIENINLLDTSNVTDMSYMFYRAGKLESLDLSGWDISSVINMSSMFSEASSLKSIEINSWDVSNVTKMSSMFSNVNSLTSLDLSKWDVSNVTNMSGMFGSIFSSRSKLTDLNISTWNTSNVTSMAGMFINADSLASLDLSKWDVSNVTNMMNMFSDASSLTSLDLSSWDTSNVENMSYMFLGTKSLTSLDLSGWNVEKAVDMKYMFGKSTWYSFENLNLSNWVISGITDIEGLFKMRMAGEGLRAYYLNLSNWNISKIYSLDSLKSIYSIGAVELTNWEESEEVDLLIQSLFDKFPNLQIVGAGYFTKDLNDLNYNTIPPVVYSGEKFEPPVEIFDGDYKLIEGQDYTIEYGENINVSSGGYIYIRGKERYSQERRRYNGDKNIYFEIMPASLKLDTLPKASSVPKHVHLSESIITGGKVVDSMGKEVIGTYSWDWNNIPNQTMDKSGEYKARFHLDGIEYFNYEPLYFMLKVNVSEDIDQLNGWIKTSNKWYYYKDSIAQAGWLRDGGKWYYLDSRGEMQTGWIFNGGKWYYLKSSGEMQTGWFSNGGKWYYLNSSGAMETGWLQTGGKWYYLNNSGAMETGWILTDGNWYYLSDSGAMQIGWQFIESKWYYLYNSGAMAANTTVGSYRLGSNGAML